jgi:hypothetical protein
MSSSSPPSNIGGVDLESVLNVRRRTLASISEVNLPQQEYRYTDTIYLKREDNSNSILSINSKIAIFGELHFLCSIFERYTSNIIVHEDLLESNSNKSTFSATFEEDEAVDEDDTAVSPIVSNLRQTSVSSQSSSSSPPKTSTSPKGRKTLGSVGRSQTVTSGSTDYSSQNLEGKRYGCIQLPTMKIIEILEILFRSGLELVNQSSDYDNKNVLHQNFILSKTRHTHSRLGQPLYSRTSSFAGT